MIEPVKLIQSPTPLHRLEMLSDEHVQIWIKRDDLTGFAGGGNKGRKLEFLIADVIAQGADVVVTNGALQSNFIRQLAAACSRFGIACAAAVMDCPFDSAFGIPDGPKLQGDGGNVLLDRILGVELRVATDATWEDLWLQAERLAQEYERKGHKVYRMPTGGSTPLGALAFVQAGLEVAPEKFDWIVTASSSGSTQAGLTYAFHGSPTRVVGIACDPEEDLYEDMARLCAGLDELTKQSKSLAAGDFDLRFDWVGPGYGVVTDNGMEAIKMLARTEGIFLDPVYSSKSFAALLDLIQMDQLSGKVLFWHTGGFPSLFALPPKTL